MKPSRVVGVLLTLTVLSASSTTASASPGQPDPSFGASSVFSEPFGFGPAPESRSSNIKAVAVMPDGRIIAVGTASDGGGNWKIIALRLLDNGTLDPSFGSGGWEYAYPIEQTEHDLTIEPAYAMYLEADGSVVVGGARVQGRLTTSGALDPTFANGQSPIDVYALSKLPSGDLLAAGEEPEAAHRAVIERTLPDGKPDATFGPGGLQTLPIASSARVKDVDPLPDGDILLAGTTAKEESSGRQASDWVAEITANGSLNTSFGTNGIVYLPGDGINVGLVQEPNGLIVLAGEIPTTAPKPWSEPDARQMAAWGLTPQGTIDNSFGSAGETLIPLPVAEDSTHATAAIADATGHLFISGVENSPSREGPSQGLVAELSSSGQIEAGYGTGGLAEAPAGTEFDALTIDSDGRVLAAGAGPTRGAALIERLLGTTGTALPPGPTVAARPTSATQGKPVIQASVNCRTVVGRISRRHSRKLLRCTVRITHVEGHWRSLQSTLSATHERPSRQLWRHIRLPRVEVLTIPDPHAAAHVTVLLRDGHQTSRRSWRVSPR
jgi:uncharacterized delta-60 repeat protein